MPEKSQFELSADVKVLRSAFAAAAVAAQGRAVMPVLSHALLRLDGGALTVVGTDLDVVVSRAVAVDGKGTSGSVAVPAAKVLDILKVLPPGEASVSVQPNNHARITSGSTAFRVAGLPAADFPELPPAPGDAPISLAAAELIPLVERIVRFVPADSAGSGRPYNGLLVERISRDGEPLLRLVATDGHRLAYADHPLPRGAEAIPEKGVLLSRKGVAALRGLAEEAGGDVLLSPGDKFVSARCGDATLWIRAMENNFPDYRQLIRLPDRGVRAKVRVADLLETLRRVGVMAEGSAGAVKLHFSPDKISVSCATADVGEASDVAAAEVSAETSTSFNWRSLADCLSGIDGETAVLLGDDALGPFFVQPDGPQPYLAVIMPMRTA